MAETVEVPFQIIKEQLLNNPWLEQFFRRFEDCFEYDPARDCYFYFKDEPDGR